MENRLANGRAVFCFSIAEDSFVADFYLLVR